MTCPMKLDSRESRGRGGEPTPLKWFESLNIDAGSPFFKLFKTEKLPGTGSPARSTDFVPFLSGFQIGFPERPGAALAGADRVHRAFPCLWIKKRTIAVLVFCQRHPAADGSRVKQADFADRFVQIFGNLLQFFLSRPNHARIAGAAIAALRTRKLQAVSVPWGLWEWI